jgi:hypothetical protein
MLAIPAIGSLLFAFLKYFACTAPPEGLPPSQLQLPAYAGSVDYFKERFLFSSFNASGHTASRGGAWDTLFMITLNDHYI